MGPYGAHDGAVVPMPGHPVSAGFQGKDLMELVGSGKNQVAWSPGHLVFTAYDAGDMIVYYIYVMCIYIYINYCNIIYAKHC